MSSGFRARTAARLDRHINRWANIYTLAAAIIVTLTAVTAWWSHQPFWARGLLFALSCALLQVLVVLVLRRIAASKAVGSADPVAVTTASAPTPVAMETAENLDRLRQLRGPCQRAAWAVTELIRNEVSGKAIERDDFRGNVIVRLLMEFPVKDVQERSTDIGLALESIAQVRTVHEGDFAELVEKFAQFLTGYDVLCNWYLTAARVIVEQGQFKSQGYKELSEKHALLVAKLDSLEGLPSLSRLYGHAGLLRTKLPPHEPFSVADLPAQLRPSSAVSRALTLVEISIGQKTETNFVGCMTMIERNGGKPIATMLSAYFDDLRITNNDQQATTIQEIWMEVDGKKPLETDKCALSVESGTGDTGLIGARRPRTFTFQYMALFPLLTNQDELTGRVVLCLKAAGLGEFRRDIPDWMFIKNDVSSPQS